MTRPFLVLGSDKACADYALSVAHENSMHFVDLEASQFPLYEKAFYTSSLDQAKTIFYLRDSHKLTIDDAQLFVEMVKDSPHRFLLASTSSNINWYLRKACIFKPLEAVQDELTFYLKNLLTEPNRHFVLENLQESDPVHLFHILKFGAWQNPETLDALIQVSQNLYKVKKSYFLSMLVFAVPPKAYPFGHKNREENEMQKSVKKKIRDNLPRLKKSEVANAFLLMKNSKSGLGLELSEDENNFLGISKNEIKQTQAEPFLKPVNLSDYF